MKKLIVLSFILGSLMTSHAETPSSGLPDFDKLWDYSDPAATRAKFTELLPQAETSGDKDYHDQLLTQIARTYSLADQFDSAHAILDKVEAGLAAGPSVTRVRYLLERGRTLRSSGKPAESLPLFEEAFNMGKALKDEFHTIDAAHMVAIVVEAPEDKRKWNLIGIELANAAKDQRARNWRAALCNNMGWDYFEESEYDKALAMFEQALAAHIEKGNPEQINIARWSVAKGYRMVGRIDEAFAIQKELLDLYVKQGSEDGYVYEELGELYVLKNDTASAEGFFAKAYRALSNDKWLSDNYPERMDRMRRLGKVE